MSGSARACVSGSARACGVGVGVGVGAGVRVAVGAVVGVCAECRLGRASGGVRLAIGRAVGAGVLPAGGAGLAVGRGVVVAAPGWAGDGRWRSRRARLSECAAGRPRHMRLALDRPGRPEGGAHDDGECRDGDDGGAHGDPEATMGRPPLDRRSGVRCRGLPVSSARSWSDLCDQPVLTRVGDGTGIDGRAPRHRSSRRDPTPTDGDRAGEGADRGQRGHRGPRDEDDIAERTLRGRVDPAPAAGIRATGRAVAKPDHRADRDHVDPPAAAVAHGLGFIAHRRLVFRRQASSPGGPERGSSRRPPACADARTASLVMSGPDLRRGPVGWLHTRPAHRPRRARPQRTALSGLGRPGPTRTGDRAHQDGLSARQSRSRPRRKRRSGSRRSRFEAVPVKESA